MVPVRLLFAKSYGGGPPPTIAHGGSGNYYNWRVDALIEVENIAYQKRVIVRWRNGDCQDTEATYIRPAWGNHDLWRVHSPTRSEWIRGCSGVFRFAICYMVAGQTYWDNNGGRDYWISGRAFPHETVILGAINLLLQSACVVDNDLVGQVIIKNHGYMKQVEVIYTTDRWAHVQTMPASFVSSSGYHPSRDQELWEFRAPLAEVGDETEIRFALRYEVNGATYWDNNACRDYVITRSQIIRPAETKPVDWWWSPSTSDEKNASMP